MTIADWIWVSDPQSGLARAAATFGAARLAPDAGTELCAIMNARGSDKARVHNYTRLYDHLLGGLRKTATRVFELGLGTNHTDIPSSMGPGGTPGASHRGWRDYFQRAHIFGADVDRRILFTEDRIDTFYVDQTDSGAIRDLWIAVGARRFALGLGTGMDIVIDDGLHTLHANRTFLEGSLAELDPEGIYIIEDIAASPDNMAAFRSMLADLALPTALFALPGTAKDDNVVAVASRASFAWIGG